MKTQFLSIVLCIAAVAVLLFGCSETLPEVSHKDDDLPNNATLEHDSDTSESEMPAPDIDDGGQVNTSTQLSYPPYKEIMRIPYADIQTNWGWAISNGNYENPGSQLVAVEYASPDSLPKITLAASPAGLLSLQYMGEKQASGNNGDYYPIFEGVTGPSWLIRTGSLPNEQAYVVLLPASVEKGILTVLPAEADDNDGEEYYNHGHPTADQADIARIEELANDRQVVHSELLATDSSGGRVALFQFANRDYGLLMLAYFQDERLITKEFTTDQLYEGKAAWRADAQEDDVCLFEVTLLCETDIGLLIGFLWYGPEGTGRYLLLENDGKFCDFILEAWYYSIWDNVFTQFTQEISNPELWPDLSLSALYGIWEGQWDYRANREEGAEIITYTFRPDGSGERRIFNRTAPITYYVDNNKLVCKWENDVDGNNIRQSADLYYAKIDGNQLILDGYPTLTKKD